MLRQYVDRGMDGWIDIWMDGWRETDRETDTHILWTNFIICTWPWHWIPLWQSLTEHSIPSANFLNFQLQDLIGVFWMKGNAGKQLYVSLMESICLFEHSWGTTGRWVTEKGFIYVDSSRHHLHHPWQKLFFPSWSRRGWQPHKSKLVLSF